MRKPEHYWACARCWEARGGVFPEGHTCTMTHGECPYCKLPATLIPWVDFNWPKDKSNDRKAKVLRD